MRVICAWCNGEITSGEGGISHGICADCAAKMLQSVESLNQKIDRRLQEVRK